MAAATISVEQDQFCCSVCLEVLRDPVTIPCGHSYCLDCIEDYWNTSKQKDQYSCPQCRQVFSPRPLLSRNLVLAEVVEKVLRSKAPASQQEKPEEVKCGVCKGRRTKAVRSCLMCLQSYCAAHLKAHDERFHRRGHLVIPATEELKDKLCPQHAKLLRLYCTREQRCVCSHCAKEKHGGHETVSVVDERASQQKKLKETSLKSSQQLKETEKELRYIIRYIKHSTEAVVEESDRVFSRLIRAIEKQSSDVKEMIRVQERLVVLQAEEMLDRIQRELAEHRKAEAELERLSRSDDHIHFLQKCKSLHFPSKTLEMPNTDAFTYLMYKAARDGLGDLRGSLDETLQKELSRVSDKANSLKESFSPNSGEKTKAKDPEIQYNSEPKREDFLHYYSDPIFDLNTANTYLSFSEGRRSVTTRSELQPYPEHPERFTNWAQVLCRAGMAGRCYWEVEWSGSAGVSVGVCYKSINRIGGGSDCKLGHNSKSWSLDCSSAACSFQHNKESVALTVPSGSRIGLYLDYRAGILSFYNVSDSMVLLHTVKATFSQPVYPGFWVGLGSTLKLCSL